MTILNRIKAFGLILFVITGYALFLLIMWISKALSRGDFISNITIFVGWIVALLTAVIYLSKTRKDNQKLKKEEIRRSLEIDAFREISKSVTSFSDIIGDISYAYSNWPSQLKLHLNNPQAFRFNKAKIDLEPSQHTVKLLRGLTAFLLAIEGNEIAVIQFDRLQKYIQFRVYDINKLILNFQEYLIATKISQLRTTEGRSNFKTRCNRRYRKLNEIQNYLFDYRIELMNSMLGSIFETQVPIRKPRDTKYKILTEVATKEKVEREQEARARKYLKNNRGKSR